MPELQQDGLHLRPGLDLLQQVGRQVGVDVPDDFISTCQTWRLVNVVT